MTGQHISVIAPVYRNAATLAPLWNRLRAAVGPDAELIFVNDASPDDSEHRLRAIARRDPRLRVLNLNENVGQHRAIVTGFSAASGEWLVNLDADLQDPPEVIPSLLAAAAAEHADVVFAGRRGAYQSRGRLLTSRLYKRALSELTGAPTDAGVFAAVHRRVVERVVSLGLSRPVVVPLLAHYASRCISIPVERSRRPVGRSSYSALGRFEIGVRSLWVVAAAAADSRGRPLHRAVDYRQDYEEL